MESLQEILGTQQMDLSPAEGVKLLDHRPLADVAGEKVEVPARIAGDVGQFETLHSQIAYSDKHLSTLQTRLRNFHDDLNALSTDMEQLQARSVQLSSKIEVRAQAEEQLRQIVDNWVLSPSVVDTILNKEVSNEWRDALEVLRTKRGQIKEGESRRQLDLLVIKATERIRDYIVAKIKAMRAATASATKLQASLAQYADLYEFLRVENEPLSEGLRQAYVNTARWYYSSRFGRYIKATETLLPQSSEVLAGDDLGSSGGRRLFSRGDAQPNQHGADSLSIGMRGHLVEETQQAVKPGAEQQKLAYPELAYLAVNLTLVDNACSEYEFLSQFFGSQQIVQTTWQQVFGASVQQAHSFTRAAIVDQRVDTYAVLLCIRIIQRLELAAQKRSVPVLQDYCNLELISLWPKFQQVMDNQCSSVRKASTRAAALSQATAAPSLPHAVTQQVSTLLYGLLTLCNEHSVGEPVDASVRRFGSEFESFLTKVSSAIKNEADRERFLRHNYALVNTVLGGVDTDSNPIAKQQLEHFEKLTNAFTSS